MALSDTFTTLGNTIINLVNSRTEHKQNKLVAGDGIQITENTAEKNADICIHPDIEAAFQSVIDELNMEALGLPVILLEDIADGSASIPKEPFIVSTNMTEIPDYDRYKSPYGELLHNNEYITYVDFSKLRSIGARGMTDVYYGTFEGCPNLISVNFSNLQSIGEEGVATAFQDCTSLTSVDFSNLTSVGNYGLHHTFGGCTSLNSLSFPKIRVSGYEGISNILTGTTGCTVHLPSSLEAVISNSYLGGVNTEVLFDLPPTDALLNFVLDDPQNTTVYLGQTNINKLPYPVNSETQCYYACSINDTILFGDIISGLEGTTTNITPDFTQKGYTITLNVGISGAEAYGFIVDNDNLSEVQQIGQFMFIERTQGVYQAKVIGDQGGMHFVYQIADETTGAVASNEDNPMVTTGEDITLDVTLTQVNSGS